MQKHVWTTLIGISGFFLAVSETQAQYIEYTYDAAGNRVNRQYIPPPPPLIPLIAQQAIVKDAPFDITNTLKAAVISTSGSFSVQLKEPVNNAPVNIIDVSGRTIMYNIANGNRLEYNLNPYPTGVYFIKIWQKGRPFVIKVVKH